MKNIRKIVAILAAALMIFSLIPMSAFAAEGDVVASIDWNDGELKFDKGEIAVGPDDSNCFKWTATGGWSATYMVVKNMDSTKDYTVTMKVKGSVNGNMGITIQNGDWGDFWNAPSFAVTTEWSEVVWAMPAGSIPFAAGNILFKFQDVGVAMDLYVDDFVITEGLPKKPLCENGDFESGDVNWILSQGSTVDATAVRSGSYGAHLVSGANWNSMLERTFDVVAGKNYELTYWAKAISGGANIKYLDQNWQGAAVSDGIWFSKSEWTQVTAIITAVSDKFYFQFCGAGTTASELYVDDVKLMEVKDPSFDGYIYNGDFETGKTDHWTNLWGSSSVELVAGMNGDYALKGTSSGAWNQVYQEVAVTPNTNYTVWAYAKDASNSALWIKNAGGNGDITNKAFAAGSDWSLTSVSFNSGSNTSVWVGLMGMEAGATYTVDDIFMFEAKAESNDGYIKNGDFETGSASPWENLWGSCPTVEVIKGGKDDNFALNIVSGEWKHLRQTGIAVEANTNYKVSAWAKNVKDMALLVKDNADTGNILNQSFSTGDEWTYVEYEFNSGDNTAILFSLMGCTAEACGIFDNIKIEKVVAACEHEYDNACDVDCNLCYETREVTHNVVHVEAEAATCTAEGNIEYWFCDVCGMAWLDAECTLPTNLKAVKLPMAEHTYENCLDADCDVCGATREPGHNMTHNPAKDAIDCANPGNIENWYCSACGEYFADEFGNQILNPWFIQITVDCVKPEGLADCASWTCETCGNENFGTGEHDVLICQGGICSKCNAEIAGVGCQNYDTPACEDGVCSYCGGFVAGFGHENGAVAPCVDGECAYGCGLTYPATEDHVDADGDDYCDNCWNHLACIDEDGDNQCDVCWSTMPHDCIDEDADGFCDICWTEMPVVEILYGDVNGDGNINNIDVALLQQHLAEYDVTLNMETADANGDGNVNNVDLALLQQYLAEYDVTLGPAEV